MRVSVRPAVALLWALTVAVAAAAAVLLVLGPGRPVPEDIFGGIGGAAWLMLGLAFATVGALIVSRLPGHRVGCLFGGLGLLIALCFLSYSYATWGLYAQGGEVPGLTLAGLGWGQAVVPLIGLSLLLFPDGHLPSRRWRAVALMSAVAILGFVVAALLRPGPLDPPFDQVTNPLGVAGLREAMDALTGVCWLLTFVGVTLGARALVLRLRGARGDERQQLKWVLTVSTVVGVVTVALMCSWWIWSEDDQWRMAVWGVAFTAFPVAAGIAILRHRLYDIDVVINRALVYGALTLLLGAAYVAIALLLGVALGSGSAPATGAATLAVALAFRPLRARLQGAVDRRFNRARYDALQRVADFLEEVRAGTAAPEGVEQLLRDVVGDARLELRFLLPEGGGYVNVRGGRAVDAAGDARERTPIERAGTRLGMVLHDPAVQEHPDLLRRVVEAAGLAIEIARLRTELRRRLDEVAASRARIVAAGDAERRRIERNLHDGAQQRLVSIGLALRHAQHELGPQAAAGQTLEGALAEIGDAIRELRELARGLRPPQLDAGLAPALQELARRAAMPVAVDATPERFPDGVETAAYFIACEALTNATKHAHASRVSLSAQRRNGSLIVRVADDGVGGAAPEDGTGLSGLADRVGAHGGTLRIESERGDGTRVIAELPCGS
ncbi:MAG TPA: histidine kinase [Solirubrobacteraceae bacterium]|nr:histidine kinase [Solirubrobacteraceae bacterium]